jgi:hypothetical protein
MRIRIKLPKIKRIHADPDPQPCYEVVGTLSQLHQFLRGFYPVFFYLLCFGLAYKRGRVPEKEKELLLPGNFSLRHMISKTGLRYPREKLGTVTQ